MAKIICARYSQIHRKFCTKIQIKNSQKILHSWPRTKSTGV